MRRLALFGMVSLAALGCSTSGPSSSSEATGKTSSAIINGTPDTDPAHAGIVAFVHIAFGNQWDSLCSATVIAADPVTGVAYALTASHCVIPLASEMFAGYTKSDISKMQIVSGPSTDLPTTRFKVDDFVVADGANDKHIPYLDVCLVKFHGDPAVVAALPVMPILPPELDDMTDGSAIEFVGYGERMSGSNTMVGAKYHATSKLNTVTGVFTTPLPGSSFWLLAAPVPADGTNICQGDSGGPWLYTAKDGKQYVAGVSSIGGMNCGTFAVATRPSPLINGFIDAYTSGKPAGDSCQQCLFNTAAFPALACDTVREPCVSTSGDCNALLTKCEADTACGKWANGCGCSDTDQACNDMCTASVATNAPYMALQGCWDTKCGTSCPSMGTGGAGGAGGGTGTGGSAGAGVGAGGDQGVGGTGTGGTATGTGGTGVGTGGTTSTGTGGTTGTAGAATGTGGTTSTGTGGTGTGTGGHVTTGTGGGTSVGTGGSFAGGVGGSGGAAGSTAANPDTATDDSSGSSGGCSVPAGNNGSTGAALLIGLAVLVSTRRRKSA